MPYAFDHCIVQATLGGCTLWYDPTISQQRGEYDQVSLPAYKRALLIRPDTKDLTVVTSPEVSGIKVFETFVFNDVGGPVTFKIKTEYRGAEADFQRSQFAGTSQKEIEKGYLNYYAAQYPGIETGMPMEFFDHSSKNLFTTLEEYIIRDLWVADEEGATGLRADFYPQMLRDRLKVPASSIRTMPFAVTYPLDFEQTTELHLPETWPVAETETSVADSTFQYRQTIRYAASTRMVSFHLTYRTLRDHVPAKEVAGYIKNQNKVINDLGYRLTYNQTGGSQAKAGGITRFNWLMGLLGLFMLGTVAVGAFFLYRYDPLPEVMRHPDSIGGWLILVAIGLFFTPVAVLARLFSERYFDLVLWEGLTSAASATYNPGLAGVVVLEVFVNILLMVYAVLLIVLFVQRRSSLPRLISFYYLYNVASLVLLASLVAWVGGEDQSGSLAQASSNIFFAIVAAAIWVPYFTISKRVKQTFVRTLEPVEVPVQEPDEQDYVW